MIPKTIAKHAQFTQADYEYLTTKGYTTQEILSIWDRDKNDNKPPVTLNKYDIDWNRWNRVKIIKK